MLESGLSDDLGNKIRTVSSVTFGDQKEKAKMYFSMSAYVQDNTREFTELKLNYFWYLLHFTLIGPLVLLIINLLEKARFIRIRRRWSKGVESKGRNLKIRPLNDILKSF